MGRNARNSTRRNTQLFTEHVEFHRFFTEFAVLPDGFIEVWNVAIIRATCCYDKSRSNKILLVLLNFPFVNRSLSLKSNATFCRVIAYVQQTSEISKDPSTAYIAREHWDDFDPQLIAEGLFAAANIFSAIKLVHLFSINPHLGPLQISLGRMVIDIVKFFFIYSLVLFAFACGLNQLLWYFADLERQKCYHKPNGMADWENMGDACMKWRRFGKYVPSEAPPEWVNLSVVKKNCIVLQPVRIITITVLGQFWYGWAGNLRIGGHQIVHSLLGTFNVWIILCDQCNSSVESLDRHDVKFVFSYWCKQLMNWHFLKFTAKTISTPLLSKAKIKN